MLLTGIELLKSFWMQVEKQKQLIYGQLVVFSLNCLEDNLFFQEKIF